MGYVGAVTAACMAKWGHDVVGVDVSESRVEMINRGEAPVVEPNLDVMLKELVVTGAMKATTDANAAACSTDISMICVGTPSKRNGDIDLDYVENVAYQIGTAIRNKSTYHSVIIRSTVPPGTVRQIVIPILEKASGKRAGADFGVGMNPEFLREGTAIHDCFYPPMTIIGELDAASGEAVASIYGKLQAPCVRIAIEVAEMVKYACNAWHATKITFANEMGRFAKMHGVDGRAVMNVVCMDKQLNISDTYMRPGFAFGGSCLPKDLRALSYRAKQRDIRIPMLSAILPGNQEQIEAVLEMVELSNLRRVGLLGLSFKVGTDDLRESPLVELAERLIGKGYQVGIFDQTVQYAQTTGRNRLYIDTKIPHVSSLMRPNIDELIQNADILIVGKNDPLFEQALKNGVGGKVIVDLVGMMSLPANTVTEGICW
jgi:GDP-mannose 6-dehydrogenase